MKNYSELNDDLYAIYTNLMQKDNIEDDPNYTEVIALSPNGVRYGVTSVDFKDGAMILNLRSL